MSEVDDFAPVRQQEADDWQPINRAPPTDEMPDALQASVPEAFLDRVKAGQALARITQSAMKEGAHGMGEATPTGFEDETLNHLIDLGVFHDPLKSRPGPLQIANEAVMIPAAKLWEGITRATAGGIHGAGGAFGQIVEEFGGSQGQANRAKNEVINAGNWAMIEGGMGRFSRPQVEGGAVGERVVGGLPRPEDFTNAGKVLESPHAETNLRRMWQEDGITPAEAVHDAQTDAFLKNDLTAPQKIIAFHGSGYDFARFDLSRVNTGEGNQAYGHGLYFAESKDVAKSYQETLGPKRGGGVYDMDQNSPTFGQFLQMSEGNLYQVAIDANRDHLLDLDKPVSQQSQHVQSVLKKLGLEENDAEAAYRRLGQKVGPQDINDTVGREQAASAALSKAGIPGIKYLDKSSRGKSGTQNFVVFSDDSVTITHKNGIPVETLPKDWMNADDLEALTSTGGKPGSLSAAMTEPGDIPLDVQPAKPPGSIMASIKAAGDTLLDIGRDAQMLVAPMARGTRDSMAMAKDFANALRRNRWDWARIDENIQKRFDPEARARMWSAADEESVSLQLKEPEHMREHQGLSTLEPAEKALVDELQTRAQNAWVRARDVGMVEGEGLPSYTPRMILNTAGSSAKETVTALDGKGSNLRTKTANLLKRKYMESQETEAAAKAKYGDEAMLARDIRVLPLATSHLEDAIAGRTLINNIKDYGARTGAETVVEGAIPAGSDVKWFTLDHPAFRTWRTKFDAGKAVVDAEGNTVFEQVPLYVHGDFEGPLRAVLQHQSGPLYGGMMALKGKTMSMIMNSPMIHNAVEWGRALPAMPGKVATFKVYFEGNRAKNNPAIMGEAIDSGLVPIGHRFFNQDISGIMEAPDLTPGRSWTAKVLAAVPGLFDEAAGAAVKRAIDKAGDFWHNTLLWDRVADLQMGLYTNLRADAMAKGIDQQTASRMAAHFANRYAGALPKEAMSDAATKISNMLLFSRSFTMGNLGVLKDVFTGLPKDVLAQIERDAGFRAGSINEAGETAGPVEDAVKMAKGIARRKAMAVVALDMGLMYVGNSLLQNAMNVMFNDSTLDKEAHGYAERFLAKMQAVKEHPLELLQPLKMIGDLSATSENEPGKGDRVKIGYAKDGTAIYARNPAGKIGDEFIGYMTGPLDMMRRKLGTIARPAWQIMSNDAGFGRKVYDPDADTPAKYLRNLGLIAKHLVGSQFPEGQFQAAVDLVKGQGDAKVNAMQAFGPFAGVTFSKGAPGGPAVGEMYASRAQHEFQVNKALPDIRRQIQRGDVDGAISAMTELDIPAGLQRFYIKTTLNPATRMSPRAVRDFYLHATPEQRQRFERARQAPPSP